MCKKIVREQYPKDHSKWSRLWNSEDIYCAFVSKEIKRKWFTTKIFAQMKKVFAKMKKLRLLKVYYSLGDKHEIVFAFNFHGEKLVAINLKSSNIKELLKGKKCHAELKFIDLSNSQQLIKIPKWSRMPKLEKLNLEGCRLWLSHSGIRELPTSIECLEALESLWLSGCSNFEKFPEIQKNMENLCALDLEDTPIKELSCLIGHLPRLEYLHLRNCKT
ncbi:hypothetical protein AAG906_012858 [Vitis piasezkii]